MASTVSISSLKGGVGKTSVALGLASAAQASGLRVLVVDLDPHADASTGLAANVAAGADIGAMLADPGSFTLADEIIPSSWVTLGSLKSASATGKDAGVWVARGSARSVLLESLEPEATLARLVQLLGGVHDDFDIILIDCPPTLGRLTEMAWAASDRVISVAEPSLFSVAGSERTLKAIARFEANSSYAVTAASIVVNKVRAEDPEHDYRIDEMRSLFGDLVAEATIPEAALFQRIQGSAYPVHYWPEAEAQPVATAFTDLLLGLFPLERS
ncbi:MAG: ParA family protein [Rothia sp. (in: high G+C Gram-positive bacteria)]|nr:ParA family protein [Rothia sp. (in: high G+C Gram-positive bacteria)]